MILHDTENGKKLTATQVLLYISTKLPWLMRSYECNYNQNTSFENVIIMHAEIGKDTRHD